MLRETAWQIESQVGGFMPIPRFNLAVLDDQLGFKGFNAGLGVNKEQVPKPEGTAEDMRHAAVPSGLRTVATRSRR